MATFATSDQLLVIIDPAARQTDGESVRIVKDVLSAGATTKVCLPDGPEEFARVLSRRGSRRPVVVGDDGALIRAVTFLHRQRELAGCVLSVVPVGGSLGVAHALGVPTGAVAAARAVLDGVERRLDLLVDDSDGVVLGALRIPPLAAVPETADPVASRGWLRPYQTLVRSLSARPAQAVPRLGPARLRVEVDGRTVVDLDQPVEGISVTPGGRDGLAEVEVRPLSVGAEATPVRAAGRTVTVTGADFRYRADVAVAGPVRRRTWRVVEGAWGLTVPGTP
ncbi:diacylglycerol kinase family protein [Streptomyces sp. NPDC002763]|uniref:diacylglycerol kinase family protein n=1 Tax=Streptomyces sp. NPDC002763 TaxID=3154427 RepID=UPI0033298299